MYLNTLCFSPVGCRVGNPMLLTSWPEIFCLGILRAVRASLFSIQKRHDPIGER
jgi:hypothetical protein